MRAPYIFAVLKNSDGKENSYLFDCWEEYHKETFSPDVETVSLYPLLIHGRTYRDRQASLRELAINVHNADVGGLYWSDCITLGAFFEENGRKLGLLQEFRENAIC